MKKFISILSAGSIAAAMLPCCVSAAESGKCGENLTWTFDDNGTLTISGTGAMEDYGFTTSYDPYSQTTNRPWRDNVDNIKNIIVEDGVTSIGSLSFASCKNLTSVELPDTVTVLGYGAFAQCSALSDITLPDGITEIKQYLFDDCHNLTSVNIPDGVTIIGTEAFSNCWNLTSLTIPDSVTEIGTAAFNSCGLTSMELPDSVTSIEENAFQRCNLTNIILPDGIKTIKSGTFSSCNLTSIEIPDSVTSIGMSAFEYCDLTSITIPESVKIIGRDAFRGCTNLKEINLPPTTKLDSGVFYNTGYSYDMSNAEDGLIYLNNHLISGDNELSGNCIIKNGTEILEDRALYWTTNLTSVVIPDTVTRIGEQTLAHCKNLKIVTMSNNITAISDEAFMGCTSLESIYIPSSTMVIGFDAFKDCVNLKDIYYANSEEQWNNLVENDLYSGDFNNATIHFNCKPVTSEIPSDTNTVDIASPSEPEFILTQDELGYEIELNIHKVDYCSEIITVYYKNGKLIDVSVKTPTSHIVDIYSNDDADHVQIWTLGDKIQNAANIDL